MSSERIQEALGPVYGAAELALKTKAYAQELQTRGAPEGMIEEAVEYAFQAAQALRAAVLELDQAAFQSRGSHRPPGSAGLN